MLRPKFPYDILSMDDLALAMKYLVGAPRSIEDPDLIISPDGEPYLYRWYLKRQPEASIYFHIQTRSDPERPLHDHPWDNTTVMLAGEYVELYEPCPELVAPEFYDRWAPIKRPVKTGRVIFRPAKLAHRLLLPLSVPYAMTLFMTGPKIREWGFWYKDGFHPHEQHEHTADGVSIGSHG